MSELSDHHAVVIGINRYINGIPELRSAVPDARAVTRVLKDHQGYADPIELTDEEATLERLTDLLRNKLPSLITPDSGLVFYFAGHGSASETDGPQSSAFNVRFSRRCRFQRNNPRGPAPGEVFSADEPYRVTCPATRNPHAPRAFPKGEIG